MVVGDDQVNAESLSCSRRIESPDSSINTDDQANVSSGGALDDIIFHAVAFANTVWNMEVSSASTEFDGGLENDNRGGAVNIVVAVNQDAFLAFDGRFQSIECGLHAGHEVR